MDKAAQVIAFHKSLQTCQQFDSCHTHLLSDRKLLNGFNFKGTLISVEINKRKSD